jgi:hypothetical protein
LAIVARDEEKFVGARVKQGVAELLEQFFLLRFPRRALNWQARP